MAKVGRISERTTFNEISSQVKYPRTQFNYYLAGAPPNMNVKAQKARHDMNRMMGDVVVSFDLLSIPHVVFYQPAPITGGYAQNLDVIVNTFDLYSFQIPSEKVFDCTDAARFNEPSPFWTRWPSSAQANVQRRLAPHALCRFCPEDYRGCRRESLAL
jgi:hypothetical protein